jgi:hypothetical protein
MAKTIYDHAAGPSQLLLHRDVVPAAAAARKCIVNVEPTRGATTTRVLPPKWFITATG